MSDISRLSTLIYKMAGLFRVNKSGDPTGIIINKTDIIQGGGIVGDGIKKITVGNVAPLNPSEGDIWIDTSTIVPPET